MIFITDTIDLNLSTFNEDIDYHVLPEFRPPGDYLKRLSSEIRSAKFHDLNLIR
jgi:hypothetical protein